MDNNDSNVDEDDGDELTRKRPSKKKAMLNDSDEDEIKKKAAPGKNNIDGIFKPMTQ
jgi:hypothetical protein